MTNKKIISVIIPAYNVGKLVCEAIESCINQQGISADEYEIIVINDGSSDSTPQFIANYQNISNIKIITQENQGLSCARNRGIKEATGSYLLFLDADDWLDNRALSILKKHCDSDAIVVFPLIYTYPDGKTRLESYKLSSGEYNPSDFIDATIGQSLFNIIPAQNKLYPSHIFKDDNHPFIPGILHEDNPFFVKVLTKTPNVIFVNERIYYYRQNREGSITGKHSIKNFKGVINGIDFIQGSIGYRNQSINYLVSSLHIFQNIIPLHDGKRHEINRYYRQLKIKKQLIKLILHQKTRAKLLLKSIALIIDPVVLRALLHIRYDK